MAASASIEQAPSGDLSTKTGLAISILIHLLVLVGIPLLLQLTARSVSFERPATFQLVTAPPSLRPVRPTAKPVKKKLAKPTPVKKISKESTARPVPAERSKPKEEENVDELSSVLNELPEPASIVAPGDFKYNWYLQNVQQKISRYWNPPTENQSLSVSVAFAIASDGSISDPKIVKESGDNSLDNLALRAVKLAAPFGKLPPGFSGNRLELTCTLIPTRGQ